MNCLRSMFKVSPLNGRSVRDTPKKRGVTSLVIYCRPAIVAQNVHDEKEACMSRRIVLVSIVSCIILLALASTAFSQQAGQAGANAAPAERRRPGPAPLFWREDWKPVQGLPVEHPID